MDKGRRGETMNGFEPAESGADENDMMTAPYFVRLDIEHHGKPLLIGI